MSLKEYYNKRFSLPVSGNVVDAASEIVQAHEDIIRLLDVIIDIGDAGHFDQDHLEVTVRSAMARLAEVEASMREVEDFCISALTDQQRCACAAETAPIAPPAPPSGGLSAMIGRVRDGGISDRIDNFAQRSVGGYRFDHGDAIRAVGGLSGFRRGDEA